MAFRNVHANIRASTAALLSVSVAFFSILLFDGYIRNVSDLYLNVHRYRLMYGDILIQNPMLLQKEGKSEPIAHSLTRQQQKIVDDYLASRAADVVAAIKNLDFVGTVSNGRMSTIFLSRSLEQEAGLKLRGKDFSWNALYGNPLHVGEPGQKILLGQALARTLGCRPTLKQNVVNTLGGFKDGYRAFSCDTDDVLISTTTDTGQVNSLSLNVSGITDAGLRNIDARYIMSDLKDAQTLLNTDRVGYYSVLLSERQSVDQFINEFRQTISSHYPEIQITRWQNHPVGDSYNRTVNLLKIFRNFLIFVLISISSLSIGMTFSKNVKERTNEIGLLKSLGFTRRKILSIFLLESILLCALGIIVGLICGYILLVIINTSQIYYKAGMISENVVLQINPHFAPLALCAFLLGALVLGACYLTARSTLRKSAVECLTYS